MAVASAEGSHALASYDQSSRLLLRPDAVASAPREGDGRFCGEMEVTPLQAAILDEHEHAATVLLELGARFDSQARAWAGEAKSAGIRALPERYPAAR